LSKQSDGRPTHRRRGHWDACDLFGRSLLGKSAYAINHVNRSPEQSRPPLCGAESEVRRRGQDAIILGEVQHPRAGLPNPGKKPSVSSCCCCCCRVWCPLRAPLPERKKGGVPMMKSQPNHHCVWSEHRPAGYPVHSTLVPPHSEPLPCHTLPIPGSVLR